jgi:outer membrane protein assembly factor BamB
MKKVVSFIIILLLVSPTIISSIFAQSTEENTIIIQNNSNIQTFQGGSRYPIQGWVYVQIKGDPYERGYQYGYLLYEEILDLMNRWSNMILNHPQIKTFRERLTQQEFQTMSSKWWDFASDLAVSMYWNEFPNEYKEEIRGIAAGVTDRGGLIHGNPVTFEDVLASNEMYEILSKLTDRKIRKGVHPLFTLYNLLKPDMESYASVSATEFISAFIPDSILSYRHKCSSFIATGNATKDGQLIISNSMWSSIDGAGMWWWSYYIALRWNIILDVIPTSGNRFQMSCAPGYIWSDHDFYQNNAGIVFIETTLPQGIWKEKGLPLAVRARKAVQYANSIDDVITYLQTNNDGVMNAVWLIGDTKTGEIARYELGMYQDAVIERTFNGFQWSSNNPIDFGVRWEKMDWKLLSQQLLYHIFLGYDNYQYHTPWYLPASRDIAFEELGSKYYGSIDVEIVKEIMSTDPISTHSPDCKITCTDLVENNGIWVFTGNPEQKTLSMANFDKAHVTWEEILPVGWVKIYGKSENLENDVSASPIDYAPSPNIAWQTETNVTYNDFSAKGILVNNTWYCTSSTGYLYAIDALSGTILWDLFIGTNPVKPVYWNHNLFIGTREGLKKVDLGWFTTGEKRIDPVISPPLISQDVIVVGTESGTVYAYDIVSGLECWTLSFEHSITLSSSIEEILVISSGSTIYGIHLETGLITWQFDTDAKITIPPFINEGVGYFGSWDSQAYALNVTNGDLLWSFETGWGIETTPVIFHDLVLFGSHDGIFYALNKTTGSLVWKKACNAGIHGSPIIANGYVIFGSDDGFVYCLDALSGNSHWMFAPGRTLIASESNYFTTAICSNLIMFNDLILFASAGTFYALYL